MVIITMIKKIQIFQQMLVGITLSLVIINTSFAQVPGVTPSMMSDFSRMSPADKRNLANQYGVDINDLGIGDNPMNQTNIGVRGERLDSTANDQLIETVLSSEDNKEKARAFRESGVPIFERNYSTIKDLPIYGKSLFDGKFSTFAPTDYAPVPNNYVIGPGDTLRILLYGIDDKELRLLVSRDGSIDFPELGNISIAGMTFSESSKYIQDRISKQMIGIEASISIGRLKSISVFMAGEANIPGTYSVSGLSTVSQLLFVAGGITDIGSIRNIQVRRANKIIETFDLYKLLTEGNSDGDIRLQSGDVVFVPAIQKSVYIDGAVNRPGKYEITKEESISDLLRVSGGITSRAFIKQVSIERYNNFTDLPSIINIDLTRDENLDFKLFDGDIIRLAQITDRVSNSITFKGALKRPGKYGWFENISFTDIFNAINEDFSNNFDLTKGLIVRRKPENNYDIEVLDFNIRNALDMPKSMHDPILELHDEVIVFSLGHNDDRLNNREVYLPIEDIEHPMFGQPEPDPIRNQLNTAPIPGSMNDEMSIELMNTMSDQELQISLHESKRKFEYDLLNRGKRRILLEPIIKKLYRQASSETAKIVSVSGAVKVPGDYPLIKNATYMDLVELAGGFSDQAYLNAAEVRKTSVKSAGKMSTKTSDVDLSIPNEVLLESLDHLHIRSVKDWANRDFVTLTGEVYYPGTYLITPDETLSSVIKRAGGFTNESFIEGAVFMREEIRQKEIDQRRIFVDTIRKDQAAKSLTKESEDFSVSSITVDNAVEALLSTEVNGRLIIDVPRLVNGDMTADIVLQSGDVLDVPKYMNAVTVVGEVRRAGSFVRQESYQIDDYLQLAAGLTSRADKKEIYIIRADGSVDKNISKNYFISFDNRESKIRAGDTIVIPIKSSYQTPLNLYGTVSQVIFQSIASIAAFSTIFN